MNEGEGGKDGWRQLGKVEVEREGGKLVGTTRRVLHATGA